MLKQDTSQFLGVGIYSVPEASRLTGVAHARIRRWVKGYKWSSENGEQASPPVWDKQLPEIDGQLALGFLDLVEIRVVDALLQKGVTWTAIRRAQMHGQRLFSSDHPFASGRFRTDGRTVFTHAVDGTGEQALLDLAESQFAFRRFLDPYLMDIEFDKDDHAARWWPLGAKRRIVLDPARSFGQPIVSRFGVPTAILANAARAEGSVEAVMGWYGVDRRSVLDAIDFEKKLAA